MSALLRWLLWTASLACLAGCPEKKPEGGGVTPPAPSVTPAKGAASAGGGW
ncbi:MAG TPA: hypothetical protein VK540_09045 [Polyangiaceae bacterium]|nr:hypothetical protein [Polyangiaceae bacterium]